MNKRNWIVVSTVFAALALGGYVVFDQFVEPAPSFREPASIPHSYESMTACQKQEVLWREIVKTEYKVLPDYRPLGLAQVLAMSRQEVAIKGRHVSDFAPEGWRKFLHGRASVAKVQFIPDNHSYSGLFQGADCGLLRLSLTSKVTSSRPVAPGLALKLLRSGHQSANVSALVSLEGQGQDFNFFKNSMSNIVPIGNSLGQRMVHRIFLAATKYPEELEVKDFAKWDQEGKKVDSIKSPRQLFFVPLVSAESSAKSHDVRQDFKKIPAGSAIYEIRATADKYSNFDYSKYDEETKQIYLKESVLIGKLVTTSEFIASEFGDEGIFFRHELRP